MIRLLPFLITSILFYPGILSGQENTKVPKPSTSQIMAEKIRLLKNGALLFRLHTRENSISALRKAGNNETADKVEKKQQEYNKELIAAFKMEFSFCPVYFFPANYSEALLSGHPEKVAFVNDSLVPDPSIKVTQGSYLIAESGPLEADTASYFESTYYDYSNKNLEKDESHYSNNNLGIEAIRIMNDKFVQLKDPFPYWVRLYSSIPLKRNLGNAVKKLNKKLWRYYDDINK